MARQAKGALSSLMNDERWKVFGKWVADQRAAPPHHFTQEKAADAIGISRPYLSLIENGKVEVPRERVVKIAKAIGCPKEEALRKARYKVKESSIDEKAYLARILDNLKSDRLGYAIDDLILLYDLINSRRRKRRVFDLSTTRHHLAEAVYLLHELPDWVRKEVFDHFGRVEERAAVQYPQMSSVRRAEAVEEVRSQLREVERKIKYGVNVPPASNNDKNIAIGADFHIAISLKTSGPMPPDYSILSIDACAVRNVRQSFYAELKPLNSNVVPEALAANGMNMEKSKEQGEDPQGATVRFVEWVRKVAGFGRPVFVSTMATLDWSFINWYARKFAGSNPFGYGAVDLRTYYMATSKCSWGAMSILEDHGELNFWRNQCFSSALEQAQTFREFYSENTGLFF
jgi:transcriptional regulator with XRE-family HTH domain